MRKIFVLFLLAAAPTCAQQPAAYNAPAFEAASIRHVRLSNGCFSMLPPGGSQYAVTCVTLKNLIGIAYKTELIEGGGPALDAYYDLRATVPGDKPWTNESVAPMMKQLLSERFHFAVHFAKREVPGYTLIIVKSGAKLQAAKIDRTGEGQKAGEASANFTALGAVQGRSMSAEGIAGLLSMAVHAPVVDRTNLTGTYNIDLRYAPDSPPPNSPADKEFDSQLPSFFTAIEEQLGLKLQPQKVVVDAIVIDHVDPEPTAN